MWPNCLLFADRQMDLLRNNLQRWTELLSEIRAPIATSSLYLDTLQVLERYDVPFPPDVYFQLMVCYVVFRQKKEDFPNADNVPLVDDDTFLEMSSLLGESIQTIVATSEVRRANN